MVYRIREYDLSQPAQHAAYVARERYAFPGGYRVNLLTSDGGVLCADCVRTNYRAILESARDHLGDGWEPAAHFTHWEGEPLICDHCGREIEPEYGADS